MQRLIVFKKFLEGNTSKEKMQKAGGKKTQSYVLDEAVFKIIEIFKYGENLNSQGLPRKKK